MLQNEKVSVYYGTKEAYEFEKQYKRIDENALYFIEGILYSGYELYSQNYKKVSSLPDVGSKNYVYINTTDSSVTIWDEEQNQWIYLCKPINNSDIINDNASIASSSVVYKSLQEANKYTDDKCVEVIDTIEATIENSIFENNLVLFLGTSDKYNSIADITNVLDSLQTNIEADLSNVYTKNEVDNKFSTLETNIDWKEAVETYNDISTTYPTPADGWTVNVKDTDYTYRYNGTSWIAISANAIPKATQTVDGLLTKEDKTKLDGIAADAEANQNTFSNVKIMTYGNTSTIAADSVADTLTLEAGDNVTFTPDVDNNKITIAAKDTDSKATQTNSSESTDYRVILSTNPNDTTETNTLRKSANFLANPSTGEFYAKGYRRIDLTGEVLDINTLNLSSGSPSVMLYIERTNGGASGISNIPITDYPFILDVELIRWNSTTDYITMQTFRNAINYTNEWVRICTNGAWSAWQKRVFTDANTTYSAGTGISLSGTTFSNSGVRSIGSGTINGTISVNTNGITANIAVKGLGSAAYTNSTAYAAASHTHSYLPLSGGTMTGNLSVKPSSGSGTIQLYYNEYISGYISGISNGISILPAENNSGTIGSSTYKFSSIYATTLHGALSGNASTATALTTSAGSATQPVYFSDGKPVACTYTLGTASAKSYTDSSSASAISTGTSLVTERDVYYGLPTINGSHTYTSSTSIYAPTSVGTSGYILKSGGSGAPSWVNSNTLAAGSLYSESTTNGALVGRSTSYISMFADFNQQISFRGNGNGAGHTTGIFLCTYNDETALFAPYTDNKVSCASPYNRWSQVYTASSTISTSDRNLKDNIKVLNNRYKKLFLKLIPVSFTFKDGTSGRTHIGFVAQDVEEAMSELGLTSYDFAGFCKDKVCIPVPGDDEERIEQPVLDENGAYKYIYSLRYEEFIAIITGVVQDLYSDMQDLKEKLINLV